VFSINIPLQSWERRDAMVLHKEMLRNGGNMKKLLKRIRENKKGFSLVELIVVIAIMAILVGVLGVTFIPYIEKSREGVDIDTLGKVKSVVEPAILSDEKGCAPGVYTLAQLEEKYPIITESLPNSTAAKCTCAKDLTLKVCVEADGDIVVYYDSASDSVDAFAGTKDEKVLSTSGAQPAIPAAPAP